MKKAVYQAKINIYSERNLSSLYRNSFNLVFQQLFPLIKIILIYVGPFVLILGSVSVISDYFTIINDNSGLSQFIGRPYFPYSLGEKIFCLVLLALIGNLFYLSIHSFLLRYGEGSDTHVQREDVLVDIKLHFLPVLAILAFRVVPMILLWGILGAFDFSLYAFILVAIIGTYLWISSSLAISIRINEGKTIFQALAQSFTLVNASWWQTLRLNIVSGIWLFLICLGLGLAGGIIYLLLMSSLRFFISAETSKLVDLILFPVFLSISGAYSMAVLLTGSLLQYFNLSGAKPRFDLSEDLIDQIGKNQQEYLF